jgi:hypothetical protein
MRTAEIKFGEWTPSAPDYGANTLTEANNLIPRPGGYGPFPGPVSTEDSIGGACLGAAGFWGDGGSSVIVGGASDRLFVRTGGTLTQQTSGITTVTDGYWDFCMFKQRVVATSLQNTPKTLDDVETDTSWADLGGSPPQARYCARVENFLMLGNIASNPQRVQWSAFNNPEGTWGQDRLTQAGYVDLPSELGPVQRIVGGAAPVVFQERGIQAIRKTNGPTVWSLEEIEQGSGCVAPFSVVTAGFRTFFLSQDGFKVTNGSQVDNIGANRVNQWFFETVQPARLSEVRGTVDWPNQCIVWTWADDDATATENNRLLIYSWAQDRWCSGRLSSSWIVGAQLDYTTLEEIGALYATLEDVPVSFDDPRWQARDRALFIFADDGGTETIYSLSGSTLEASLTTAEFQPEPGRRVFASQAHPLVECCPTKVEVATATQGNVGSPVFSAFSAAGVGGFAPIRADGRRIAIRMRWPAGTIWNNATGVQVGFRVSGGR